MSEDWGKRYGTARDRALALLTDGGWHSWRELERVAGVRYGARLLELRREGCQIEHQDDPSGDGRCYRLAGRAEPQEKRVRVYLREDDARSLTYGRITTSARAAVIDALGSFDTNRGKL